MRKIFVDVTARFFADGSLVPVLILWEDGRKFEIDKVIDVKRRSSLKVGGQGIRYTCKILGQTRYLFFEDDKFWFVEGISV